MTVLARISLICLAAVLCAPALAAAGDDDAIPQVHFAVFRLDFLTYHVKGVYEFSHAYRKSLPSDGFTEDGNVFWYQQGAGDFGYTEFHSRLTGHELVHAATVWNGQGGFEYPPPSIFNVVYFGFVNPAPDAITEHLFFAFGADPAPAWERVRDSDAVNRLASHGAYEVYVADHFYRVGLADPSTAEWFVIASTHPRAPDDMAFVDMSWPRTLITRDAETTPEITVHNFGDAAAAADVVFTITSNGEKRHEERHTLGVISADESRVVRFGPVTDMGLDDMVMDFQFADPSGSGWLDAYPDNDAWHRPIEVTEQPVFRVSSRIPGGAPFDMDGDGDLDIVSPGPRLLVWRNDGPGRFTDVTDQAPESRIHSRKAVPADFNGDGNEDFLLLYWDAPPQLYRGDGSGAFVDATAGAGLSLVKSFGDVALIDLENDGDIDLVFPNKAQEAVLVNNGSGIFSDLTSTTGIVDGHFTQQVSVGDLNSDGYSDLIFTNWGADAQVFINQRDGTFEELGRAWGLEYARGSRQFDYDGDGDDDVLFYREHYYGGIVVYENLGDLRFQFRNIIESASPTPGAFQLEVGDVNGDGTPDLITNDADLFLNLDGRFVDHTELLVDRETASLGQPYVADIDGDGDTDIIPAFENQAMHPVEDETPPSDPPTSSTARLRQNAPNPFNPRTIISYTIAKRSHVTLRIYNVAGQLVRTLVDEIQSPLPSGHEVEWNTLNDAGRSVSSGVYYYRLRTNGSVLSRKMVLIR